MNRLYGINPYIWTNTRDFPDHTIAWTDEEDGSKAWIYGARSTGDVAIAKHAALFFDRSQGLGMGALGRWRPTAAAAATGELIGVSPVAIPQMRDRPQYFWVQVYGHSRVNVEASAAANATLYTVPADVGNLDDATSSNADELAGIILTTARGATEGDAPCWLNWPRVA